MINNTWLLIFGLITITCYSNNVNADFDQDLNTPFESKGRALYNPRYYGPRIVGGKEVNIEDYNYQISLQKMNHFCGGSIINSRYILTAAHCTNGQDAKRLIVRAGSSYRGMGGDLYQVEEILQHPNYTRSNTDYDFSILKLESEMELSDSANIVQLPEADEPIEDGAECVVTGWGDTKSILEPSRRLRATTVPIVNKETCNEAYREFYGITERMVCAGYAEGGKDSCQGDSGGPLVHNDKLVGVVSWGKGCAEKGYYGVYARVAAVRPWIKEMSGV